GLLERHPRRTPERPRGRIDLVVGAVGEPHDDVDHRIARDDTALQRLLDALLDRRDVLLGDHAADDLVLEQKTGARRLRLDRERDVAEHALAARLADEAVALRGRRADRLAIGDLRLADVRLARELPPHAVA